MRRECPNVLSKSAATIHAMEHAPPAAVAYHYPRASRGGARQRDCSYRVDSPQLLAKSFPRKEDRRVSMSLADFLTAACKLANDKARELGWIA